LTADDVERLLDRVTAAVVARLSPQRIVLFGSFARGDYNRASDLDLVVIADVDLPFCDRIGEALEACHAVSLDVPVEVLVYTAEEWRRMVEHGSSFAALVGAEGRVLYERGSQPERGAAMAGAGTS
jgi:predicted nucleotidyltransferase